MLLVAFISSTKPVTLSLYAFSNTGSQTMHRHSVAKNSKAQHSRYVTSMRANKLGSRYGRRVVLSNGNSKLLHLTAGHQPGLMNPLARHILQLWNPGPDVITLLVIVLQPPKQSAHNHCTLT